MNDKNFKKCVLNVFNFVKKKLNNNLFSENMPHSHTRRCCVYNCSSNNTMDEMKFYMFPKDPSQREVWKNVVNRPDYAVLCACYIFLNLSIPEDYDLYMVQCHHATRN